MRPDLVFVSFFVAVWQDPHRQPWWDRLPHHEDLQEDGNQDRGRLQYRWRPQQTRQTRRRGRLHCTPFYFFSTSHAPLPPLPDFWCLPCSRVLLLLARAIWMWMWLSTPARSLAPRLFTRVTVSSRRSSGLLMPSTRMASSSLAPASSLSAPWVTRLRARRSVFFLSKSLAPIIYSASLIFCHAACRLCRSPHYPWIQRSRRKRWACPQDW